MSWPDFLPLPRGEGGGEGRSEPPPLPTLADTESLTKDSDFTRFVQPGVSPEVKNAAMKKLFADPHFNVMDGLDTYIDDYGKPDPIPRDARGPHEQQVPGFPRGKEGRGSRGRARQRPHGQGSRG
ncbi:DUF3306 domain-containing protein [Ramlibacter montanisoli]|uniref:DUF3306 domain-containing protein n=1 Tax=Ramlibacter montanisoli TaxID=2732512 RepID=UPI00281650DD|nr:DUF3306 domain-containing protein [Ramlibacter montanisoli]